MLHFSSLNKTRSKEKKNGVGQPNKKRNNKYKTMEMWQHVVYPDWETPYSALPKPRFNVGGEQWKLS